jgi:hypothetical protein
VSCILEPPRDVFEHAEAANLSPQGVKMCITILAEQGKCCAALAEFT